MSESDGGCTEQTWGGEEGGGQGEDWLEGGGIPLPVPVTRELGGGDGVAQQLLRLVRVRSFLVGSGGWARRGDQ